MLTRQARFDQKKAIIVEEFARLSPGAVQLSGRLEVWMGKGGLTMVRFTGILPSTAAPERGETESP